MKIQQLPSSVSVSNRRSLVSMLPVKGLRIVNRKSVKMFAETEYEIMLEDKGWSYVGTVEEIRFGKSVKLKKFVSRNSKASILTGLIK